MRTAHPDRADVSLLRRLFVIVVGSLGLLSATPADGANMASAERTALESRVLAVRQAMTERGGDLHRLHNASQQPWNNWRNWNNWANAWNNWGNWGNA